MSTIEKAVNKLKNKSKKSSKKNIHQKDERNNTRPMSAGHTKVDIILPWREMSLKGMLTPDGGRSLIAEELRAIKRPLLRDAFKTTATNMGRGNLIMVTSSVPGEGKSFTSINLAVSIAMELDRTALLVDADVARPSIARYLNIKNELGMVDYLLDNHIDLSDVLIKTDLPKLSILPAGRQHHYSTELLASESMNQLLTELGTRYPDRIIIFDSPPILATSEAKVLATQMGQVVMVVEAVKTSQSGLKEALSKIPSDNLTGLILNKTRIKRGGSYYGQDYYGPED